MLKSGLSARECLEDYLLEYWLDEYPDFYPLFIIKGDKIRFYLSDAVTKNSSSKSRFPVVMLTAENLVWNAYRKCFAA
jgi:hypothetical protein